MHTSHHFVSYEIDLIYFYVLKTHTYIYCIHCIAPPLHMLQYVFFSFFFLLASIFVANVQYTIRFVSKQVDVIIAELLHLFFDIILRQNIKDNRIIVKQGKNIPANCARLWNHL